MPLVFLAEIFFLVFNYHANAPLSIFLFYDYCLGLSLRDVWGRFKGEFQGVLVAIGLGVWVFRDVWEMSKGYI